MEQDTSFTQGKIFSPLLKFSIPILLALFLQAMYGAVDLIVVGQFGDASGVSAVSIGSQVMQTITGIVTGLTMGITVLLGHKIGEKQYEDAGKAVGVGICLFTTIAVIITIVMLCFTKTIASIMHAPPEAFDKTVQYIFICSAGSVFIVLFNVISGIFRGIGNSKLPLLFVGIACLTNIIGDLLFVAVFHMDAAGAAIATVLAQAVSVVLSLIIIKKRGLPFPLKKEFIRFKKAEIKRILALGSPIALQDALTNVSFLVILAIVNEMGIIASAAVGVAEKAILFLMLIPIAYMSSISAFVAQNIGAKRLDRAKKVLYYGVGTSLVIGIIMFVAAFWFGNIIASIFAKEIPVIEAAADYLKAYSFDCVLVAVLFCFLGYFNGCGKPLFVLLQGLCAALLVRIPFSYFMSLIDGVTMFQIGLASPLATVLSVILCLIYYKNAKWNKEMHSTGIIEFI